MGADDLHDSEDPERQPGADDVAVPLPGADGANGTGEERRASRHPAVLAARVAALFEVVICSGFVTQLFVAQLLMAGGLTPFTPDHRYSATFIFALSLGDAALLVGLILWFLRFHGERPAVILFGPRPLLREALLGVLLIPVVFVLASTALLLVQQIVPSLHNVSRNPLAELIRSPLDALMFAFVAVVSGGVREEVQRAFVLHRFEQYLGGGRLGVVVFSCVFGAGHIIQGWDATIATALLGAFWGVLYLARRSIAAPMVSHAGFDLAEIIRYTLTGRAGLR